MRWLAVHLPALPLEIYARASQAKAPLAISRLGRVEEVLLCNRRAWSGGVRPGMPVSGALALVADLVVLPRQEPMERAALERLAAWCGRFSPDVSLEPPQALVLEVARSLDLFGGAPALLEQVLGGVRGLGYRPRCCIAPTPGGALTLAAFRHQGVVANLEALRAGLSGLPLSVLGADERMQSDLWNMGLRRLGDLLRLPRTGLSERLGPKVILRLQRLLGEEPDPRRTFEPPASYRGRLELPAELVQADALVFPCRRLIDELAGFLHGRQAGVQRLRWYLHHAEGTEDSCLTLGAARPERRAAVWLGLLRGRLERFALPAPVRALTLEAGEIQSLAPLALKLFPELEDGHEPDTTLLDRLRARLGEDAVYGLAVAADHRPERAWYRCRPGERPAGQGDGVIGDARSGPRGGAFRFSGDGSVQAGGGALQHPSRGRADRPLWLLREPLCLESRGHRPWWGGELDLGIERERIETGWWDGLEVARDYFVATSVRGERLWVYREMRGRRRWFLHGIF